MLKKSDLAKQFESVVKQEIKNYNDSLSLIYKKINELTDKIKEFNEISLANHAMIYSQHVDLSIEVSNVKSFQQSIAKTSHDKFEKTRISQSESKEKIIEISELIKDKFNNDTKVQYMIDLLHEEVNELKKDLQIYKNIQKDHLDDTERRLKFHIQQVRKEILEMPSDHEEVRKHLEEKIKVYMLDIDKVMKEIAVSKKESSIMQKKIESIYMTIQRLKDEL